MMPFVKWKKFEMYVVAGVLVSLFGYSLTAAENPVKKETQKFHAVIIRAAGYLPGTQKAEGVDAITHATSKPGNTYVFTEKLVKKLGLIGVEARVVDFSQCPNLECVYLPGTENPRQLVDIIVFAGPAYNSKLPPQLQKLVPKLKKIVKQKSDIRCSSLVSARYPAKGEKTIQDFEQRLKQVGVKTITGITLVPNIGEEELEKKMGSFAAKLTSKEKESVQ